MASVSTDAVFNMYKYKESADGSQLLYAYRVSTIEAVDTLVQIILLRTRSLQYSLRSFVQLIGGFSLQCRVSL